MTKPMPMGCIKKEPQPTWRTFNTLLVRVGLDDPVGHLFIVDIIIFVTRTNIGTMVKCIPQEQMVGVRSYLSKELFFPFFRICYVRVV